MLLREQIARNLFGAWYKDDETMDWESEASEEWLRMADEVIRLMEWARLHPHETCEAVHPEQDVYHPDGHDTPLTLPPDDWRPE